MMCSSAWFCHRQNAKRDGQHRAADDQADAQLIEVVHEAEPILVADRANRAGHGLHEPTTALLRGSRLAGRLRARSLRSTSDGPRG